MMEWTLAILFVAAVLLLILSFVKSKQSSKGVEQQIDQLTISFLDELSQLQEKIRNIEIDAEITAQEAGLFTTTTEERLILREVIDLHRRGYSLETIAAKKKMVPGEIENLLSPYMKAKVERSEVAHERSINA